MQAQTRLGVRRTERFLEVIFGSRHLCVVIRQKTSVPDNREYRDWMSGHEEIVEADSTLELLKAVVYSITTRYEIHFQHRLC